MLQTTRQPWLSQQKMLLQDADASLKLHQAGSEIHRMLVSALKYAIDLGWIKRCLKLVRNHQGNATYQTLQFHAATNNTMEDLGR